MGKKLVVDRIKSIDELYEQIKYYDLVLTGDAPLKTALNRRVKNAELGQKAYTLRELALKNAYLIVDQKLVSDYEIVLFLAKTFTIDIEQAHHYFIKISQIWMQVGDSRRVKPFLEGIEFAIFEILQSTPFLLMLMENFDKTFYRRYKNIAVIDPDLILGIDKKMLPEKYESISSKTKEQVELENMFTFDSEFEMVDYLVEIINEDIENDSAVIIPNNYEHLSLIKSKLHERKVSFIDDMPTMDEFELKPLLSIVDAALNINFTKLKDVKSVLTFLNFNDCRKYEEYFLNEFMHIIVNENIRNLSKKSKIQNENFDVFKLMFNVRNLTYFEFFKELSKYVKVDDVIFKFLSYLNFGNSKITDNNFKELIYILDNFDLSESIDFVIKQKDEKSRSNRGVLFVISQNSVFIDRPICFYLCLDNSFDEMVEPQAWANQRENTEINLRKMNILLCQGEKRFYLIPKYIKNEPAIFSAFLEMLTKQDIKSVDELESSFISSRRSKDEGKSNAECLSVEFKPDINYDNLFSQSSLNSFVMCQKKYSLKRLVGTKNQSQLLKGILLHQFAEFYIEQKDLVKSKPVDEIVEILVEEFIKINGTLSKDIIRTEFKIGVLNLISFLDNLSLEDFYMFDSNKNRSTLSSFKKGSPAKNDENIFALKFNALIDKTRTEIEFFDEKYKIKGVIDLIIRNNEIVDYKSGLRKSKSKIISQTRLDADSDMVDFQPLMYILKMRNFNPNKPVIFKYFYLLDGVKETLQNKSTIDEKIVEVKFIPTSFQDFLKTDEFYEILNESSKERRDFIYKTGDMLIKHYLHNIDLDARQYLSKDKSLLEKLNDDFVELLRNNHVKITETLRKKTLEILKFIFNLRSGNAGSKVYFFEEDLAEFEKILFEQKIKLDYCLSSKFEAESLSRDLCDNCEFIDVCLR